MVLLSQMIRAAAITGRSDIPAWFAGRQGGRWVQQTVRAAVPTAGPRAQSTRAVRADPAETLRELTELREHGVLTEAEFEGLRARLRV